MKSSQRISIPELEVILKLEVPCILSSHLSAIYAFNMANIHILDGSVYPLTHTVKDVRSASIILSHISSTDDMLWVEKIMVLPSFLNRRISSLMILVLIGSKPLKGSSSINSSGSCRTVVINWIFCCIPSWILPMSHEGINYFPLEPFLFSSEWKLQKFRAEIFGLSTFAKNKMIV